MSTGVRGISSCWVMAFEKLVTRRENGMRAVTTVSLVSIVAASLVVGAGAQADATDEVTREQLVALKKLCDEGLLSPDVCKEKQRELLGLPPRVSGPPARGSTPSPRGAT